ncbi:MAG: phosphatase PAP2 family protein [Patescibacteria group bacterium]
MENSFDIFLFNLINKFSHKWWFLDNLGIFLAGYFGYFLLLIAVILILKEKKWQDKIYFASFTALSLILARGIIAEIIKFFVSRPRPFSTLNIQPLAQYNGYDSGMSFPSGHASLFFALAFAIFYFDKKWGIRFLIAALIMGIARIFIGVHWPLDIIVGALIGIGSAFLAGKILLKEKIII